MGESAAFPQRTRRAKGVSFGADPRRSVGGLYSVNLAIALPFAIWIAGATVVNLLAS